MHAVGETESPVFDCDKENVSISPRALIYKLSVLLLKGDKGSRGISSPICAALPSGPVHGAELVHEAQCPSEQPAEKPHQLQGTWIMHVANAASCAFRPPPSAAVPRQAREERSREEERHRRKRCMGVAGLRKGGKEEGAKKRGDEIHRREPVRRKKREKGQDIVGGSRGGEF